MFTTAVSKDPAHHPESYAEIFQRRGEAYHQAMRLFPEARREEFRALLTRARPACDEVMLDIPSGGGYMPYYIEESMPRLIFMETAEAFYRHCPAGFRMERHLGDLEALPLEDGSVDVAVSLAGSHHLPDFEAVWREIHRVLRPGGRFILADVRSGNQIDEFLNGFVNQYNSDGHEGRFIDEERLAELTRAGFAIEKVEDVAYPWHFGNRDEMTHFVKLLFGLDKADSPTILGGVERILGIAEKADCVEMNWALCFVTAARPA